MVIAINSYSQGCSHGYSRKYSNSPRSLIYSRAMHFASSIVPSQGILHTKFCDCAIKEGGDKPLILSLNIATTVRKIAAQRSILRWLCTVKHWIFSKKRNVRARFTRRRMYFFINFKTCRLSTQLGLSFLFRHHVSKIGT